jgi:hypothetical protein
MTMVQPHPFFPTDLGSFASEAAAVCRFLDIFSYQHIQTELARLLVCAGKRAHFGALPGNPRTCQSSPEIIGVCFP